MIAKIAIIFFPVSPKTIFKGNTWRAHAGKKNSMGSPVQIEYHVGKKLIYGLSDSRDIGMGTGCDACGFVDYTIDNENQMIHV